LAVVSVAATNDAAPRTELVEPFRSRVAATTGAAVGVLRVPINAFNPLTWV
jgi:hypothetical protein